MDSYGNVGAGFSLSATPAIEKVGETSYSLTDDEDHLLLSGEAPISGNGNRRSNRISGNSAANRLDGGESNDTLIGGGGEDALCGGPGADVFRYDLLNESLSFPEIHDVIIDFEWGVDAIEINGKVNRVESLRPLPVKSLSHRSINKALGGRQGFASSRTA